MSKVLGVDEAGRGPVIGSMFVAGFMVEESELPELEDLGVKDSKKLSANRREQIRDELDDIGRFELKEVEAGDIDELREVMTLNEIEVEAFADVIKRFEPGRVIVDLPEPDGDRFVKKLKGKLPAEFSEVDFVAEHGADDNYPVVSAASIVAKSAREAHVSALVEKYGFDFKSGYPHDPETIEFLETYLEEKGELPPETRRSWSTAERILKQSEQSSFDDF